MDGLEQAMKAFMDVFSDNNNKNAFDNENDDLATRQFVRDCIDAGTAAEKLAELKEEAEVLLRRLEWISMLGRELERAVDEMSRGEGDNNDEDLQSEDSGSVYSDDNVHLRNGCYEMCFGRWHHPACVNNGKDSKDDLVRALKEMVEVEEEKGEGVRVMEVGEGVVVFMYGDGGNRFEGKDIWEEREEKKERLVRSWKEVVVGKGYKGDEVRVVELGDGREGVVFVCRDGGNGRVSEDEGVSEEKQENTAVVPEGSVNDSVVKAEDGQEDGEDEEWVRLSQQQQRDEEDEKGQSDQEGTQQGSESKQGMLRRMKSMLKSKASKAKEGLKLGILTGGVAPY